MANNATGQATKRLWDRGQVYLGDVRIAAVIYDLTITLESPGTAPKEIVGQLRVVEGNLSAAGRAVLVLRLCDRRTWEFLVSDDLGSGTYRVRSANGRGLVAA